MNYTPLVFSKLPVPPQLPRSTTDAISNLDMDGPAIRAMTDFSKECPITALEQHTIEEALQTMVHSGVRSLLVVRKKHVTGLLTSYDIQGERPIQFLQSDHCPPDRHLHSAVLVSDVMTPWDALPTLTIDRLLEARAGDLLITFSQIQQSHLLVIQSCEEPGSCTVRGLISRTRLQRQLSPARM